MSHPHEFSSVEIATAIQQRTGYIARQFQLDAVQGCLNKQDVIVHAGTGSGKTLIFAAPHFVLENKTSIIISPLILLQHDQEERMRKIGLKAIAVNKEVHHEPEVWADMKAGKYQIILLSPEMAIHSEKMNEVFSDKRFRDALAAIFVDEAHTISLWGGDFRKDYRGVGRIRARLPKGVPTVAVSATMRPKVKQDIMSTLGFPSDPSKYVDVNVGNERTNVYVGVAPMRFPRSTFKDLSFLIPTPPGSQELTDPKLIPKTIVYIDDINDVTLAVIALNSWLPPSLQQLGLIRPVHAWMPASYRAETMAKFLSGEARIIICTEAAGMGCDIPDVKRVVQLGMCKSIDAFLQRIGRSMRDPTGWGEGWLLSEPWAWDGKGGPAGKSARSSCDPLLRGLVVTCDCRRLYLNRIYGNEPAAEPVPADKCCDKCANDISQRLVYPVLPQPPPAPRAAAVSGDSNPEMLSCLVAWRSKVSPTIFGSKSMLGATALIKDETLLRLSRCAPVPSLEKLRKYLVKWRYLERLADSMWDALNQGGFTTTSSRTDDEPRAESTLEPPAPTANPLPSSSRSSQSSKHAPRSQRNGTINSASGSQLAPVQHKAIVPPRWPNHTNWLHEWMPEHRSYERVEFDMGKLEAEHAERMRRDAHERELKRQQRAERRRQMAELEQKAVVRRPGDFHPPPTPTYPAPSPKRQHITTVADGSGRISGPACSYPNAAVPVHRVAQEVLHTGPHTSPQVRSIETSPVYQGFTGSPTLVQIAALADPLRQAGRAVSYSSPIPGQLPGNSPRIAAPITLPQLRHESYIGPVVGAGSRSPALDRSSTLRQATPFVPSHYSQPYNMSSTTYQGSQPILHAYHPQPTPRMARPYVNAGLRAVSGSTLASSATPEPLRAATPVVPSQRSESAVHNRNPLTEYRGGSRM